MSKMDDYLSDLDSDFMNLIAVSMQWTKEVWSQQLAEGRFRFSLEHFKYSHIYWFNTYAELFLAKQILFEMGEEFEKSPDLWSEDGSWALITNYQSIGWKG